ncbi:hypothetical protein EDEG_03586 [Edhazardia aedis USNM 41457]|uniref:Protein transport protein SEC23 n=1 Tax=Edhazardia aedis (strain USNM 41457) TaxID=1003232 RepID=J9DKM5_EDHAE|nr:hypothetical protein EDEG_03586 [Edhazardia aedis USNM 41457]|eukprot:EJW01942.1 hypothetical protein EDEG_03586 [Edhazardia aedis USNM 41457]
MEDQIREIELKDGVRLPYNVFPVKPIESLPISLLYTPLQPLSRTLSYEPIFCTNCKAIVNPFSEVNFLQKCWTCVFCKKSNTFPLYLKDVLPNNLPFEFVDTTVEYELSRECVDPCYIFLIDLCAFDSLRFELLVDAVRTAFALINDDAQICFVTFGTNINLIADDKVRRVFVFSGKKKYERDDLMRVFDRESEKFAGLRSHGFLVKKFFKKKSFFVIENTNCGVDIKLSSLDVSFMQRDPFPVKDGKRPLRCTGSAISFATSLIDILDSGTKIMLFTQGPCTFGPGTVCSLSLKDSIRSLSHILKGKAAFNKSATAFYTEMANRMVLQGTSLDIFSTTIEDIGIFEMKSLCDLTGGSLVMSPDFDRKTYLSSIIKHLKSPNTSYGTIFDPKIINQLRSRSLSNAEIEKAIYSENNDEFTINNKHTDQFPFSINGAIKSYRGFEKRYNAKMKFITTPNIAYKGVIGTGSAVQNIWKINCLRETQNITVLLEPQNPKPQEISYIQILTTSQRNRKLITRVTTLARAFDDNLEKITLGFDQEAACVLQARIYTYLNKFEEDIDLVRRIDRNLIRFVKKYGIYTKEDMNSVTLPDSMSFFPNFMYFLRRSLLVQTENSSPDMTTYFRSIVSREKVTEALTVIFPILTSYHYADGILPVEIDSTSLRPDTILLLDIFTHVLIWKGEHISNWIKQKIHEKEEYKSISDIINLCLNKAKDIVNSRMITPMFVVTEAGNSQERILLSRVNPSRQGAHIVTDDIDFDTFFRCLCKIVVES